MQGFKCQVSGATSTAPLAKARQPAQCEDDTSTCVAGAKQMIVWNQLTGNNVFPKNGQTPAYNARNGFKPGAQDDIFDGEPSAPASSSTSSSASVSITASPTAVTRVESVTTSKPALTSDGSFTIQPVTFSTSTTARAEIPSGGNGNPATVTVTVTAPGGCS